MSDSVISALRWFFLVGAITGLLQATVFYRVIRRRVLEPFFRFNERLGGKIPSLMRDARIQRMWLLFTTLVFAVLWWFAGTPMGRAWLRAAL